MRIQTSYSLLSCLAALLLIAPGAQAQTLRGVVQDESTGVAIEGALLLLLDGGGDLMGTILSDETGAFLLRAAASGRYSLRAERLGYATYTSQPISLADGAAVRVQLRLGIDAIPLEALTVLAGSRSRLGRLVGFAERRNDPAITGFFLDSEDLERRPAASPSRLLDVIPGVTLRRVQSQDHPLGLRNQIFLPGGRDDFGRPGCQAQVYVDGVPIVQGVDASVDDVMAGAAVAAVEVYPRPHSAPPQYGAGGDCGVVLFWLAEPAASSRGWDKRRLAVGVAAAFGIFLLSLGNR